MSTQIADGFRTLGKSEEVADDFVVMYYLGDLKRRVSVARVEQRLYAFDDLCTCAQVSCPLSGGLLTGPVIMCQCHGSRFDMAGRVFQGSPAAMNLRVPPYDFISDTRILVGADQAPRKGAA